MATQKTAKFYHETVCKMCTKDEPRVNTHRTDFVGYEKSNRCFNIINNKVKFPDGCSYKIHDDITNLKSLASALMRKQGDNFFLNEYPEECEHRQFIDLDFNIDDDVLQRIILALQELTTPGGEIQVLRNTVSGKVHLIINVPASTVRGSIRKKAISKWLCNYLYECADLEQEFTREKWENEIFDAQAAGIRSAFSVKVKDGKVEKPGVYAPIGVNISNLSMDEKVAIICNHSIYMAPRANWTNDVLEAFEAMEQELITQHYENQTKYKIISAYNAEKKSINFLNKDYTLSGVLINEFIYLLPQLWADKRHWGITLKHIKSAATLVNDFDPAYFLHTWSAKNAELYNKEGNENHYARCQADPASAGESLTWLRNLAAGGYAADENLTRGELGMAEIFAEIVGDSIKIVGDNPYLWDNSSRLWKQRNNKWIGNEVSEQLEKVINRRIKLLRGLKVIDTADELYYYELKRVKVLSYRGAMDIVNKVSPMLEDAEFITKINLQPDLLPIRGGLVVDLKTGITSQRNRLHNFTFECPVGIDRDTAKRELVEKFMLDICCGDADLLRYLQVSLGYCITGRVTEKAVFVWWGDLGDNGKSTLMNLLKAVLGNYCKSASKSVFIKTKSDSKLTPEREVLKDTRLVVFSETAADDTLNDEVLKMASGDDVIKVNPKYESEYEFRSYAKLLIASNHKPKINVSDAAMVKRVKLIPFLTKFISAPSAPNERFRDVQLVARMESDLLDAFFTWILEGAKKWYEGGLVDIPAVMQKERDNYLAENDEIGEFLADETVVEAGQFIPSSVLYKKYCEWNRAQNTTPKGSITFSQDVGKRFKKERKKFGQVFIGLRLKSLADMEEDQTLEI